MEIILCEYNNLTSLVGLRDLPINIIKANNCKLYTLFGCSPNVKYLNVSYNMLRSVNYIVGFKHIHTLIISNNKIQYVDNIPNNITHLEINNNFEYDIVDDLFTKIMDKTEKFLSSKKLII